VTSTTDKIAIIGAGSIGIAFALLFAQAEYQINLHDSDKQSLMSAKERLALSKLRISITAAVLPTMLSAWVRHTPKWRQNATTPRPGLLNLSLKSLNNGDIYCPWMTGLTE
jgi:2-polyprenyl-6-methoxyphenol hydroxylase-like FAD-dependent oxidoreductase